MQDLDYKDKNNFENSALLFQNYYLTKRFLITNIDIIEVQF
jgi:hypothetical protein